MTDRSAASTSRGVAAVMEMAPNLSKANRVEILRLVVDYGRSRYVLTAAAGEPNIDLDALARDSPETVAAIAAIARERLAELNTVAPR